MWPVTTQTESSCPFRSTIVAVQSRPVNRGSPGLIVLVHPIPDGVLCLSPFISPLTSQGVETGGSAKYLFQGMVLLEPNQGLFTNPEVRAEHGSATSRISEGDSPRSTTAWVFHQIRGFEHRGREPIPFVEEDAEQEGEMCGLDDESVQPYKVLERHEVPQRHEQPRKYVGGRNVGKERVILNHGYCVDGE